MAVTVFMLCSRFLSFFRDILLAGKLGASITNDVFIASQTIVGLFSSFVMQSFVSSYLPFAAEHYQDAVSKRSKWYGSVYVHGILLGIVQILICYFALNQVITLSAPGFDVEARQLLYIAVLIQMPVLLLQMINGVNDTNLQILRKYSFVQATSCIPTAAVIAYLFCSPTLSIQGIAWSSVIGNSILVVIKLPIIQKHFKPRLNLHLWDSEIKQLYIIAGLAVSTTAVRQINSLANQAFSSLLGEGNVTLLSYAMKIPVTEAALISTALSTIIFSEMARNLSSGQEEKNKPLLNRSLIYTLLLIIPFTALTIVFRTDIVRFLFQRGEFSAQNTSETARLMMIYAFSMIGFSLQDIITRSMFAYKIRKYSVISSVILVLTNIAMNYCTYKTLGNTGIALANTLSVLVIIPLLLFWCNKRVIALEWKKLATVFLYGLLLSVIGSVVAWLLKTQLSAVGVNYLATAIISGACFLLIYGITTVCYIKRERAKESTR